MSFFSYTLLNAIDPNANPADVFVSTLPSKIPRDFAVDPTTNDLQIPIVLLTGADAVLQRVWIRLRMFLGEWFLDSRIGVPWRERILIKGVDSRDVKQILVKVVESTPGISKVIDFDATIDGRTRILTVPTMTFVLDDGSTLEAKQQQPFVV